MNCESHPSIQATKCDLLIPNDISPFAPDLQRISNILDYGQLTAESLERYAFEINSGNLQALAVCSPRENGLTEHIRIFSSYSEPGYTDLEGLRGQFYQDAEHALVIASNVEGMPTPSFLALVSFMSAKGLNSGDYDGFACQRSDYPLSTAVIVQLQGVSHETFPADDQIGRNRAANILRTFKWEQVLVNLVTAWAESEGIEHVGILPASYNEYIPDVPYFRLERRYDGTAKKLGFSLTPDELWIKELAK